jgi:RNA polymerase sigma factor (sigma-70 family)
MRSELYEPLLLNPEYQKTIEQIARKQTRGTNISWEDAAQTAYEKVLRGIQNNKFCQENVNDFYRWAATVAKNAIIDMTRQDKHRKCQSLDVNFQDSNVILVDTIADERNLFEDVETKDLLLKVIDIIKELDNKYPERKYQRLWRGLIEDKNQSQLALELELNQGTISKRRKELFQRVAQMLGLFSEENIQQEFKNTLKVKCKRSDEKW